MLQIFLAVAFISLSIFIHELGHFFVARWRGLVVPRFSLFGLGSPILRKKWRGVEYCICWLPVGAYVMIPQLYDMANYEGEVPEEARNLPPANYTSKVLVALAGPAANILLAFALACVVWSVGMKVPVEFNRTELGEIPRELEVSEGKSVPNPAFVAGLQTGDIIRQVDGQNVENYQELAVAIVLGSQSDTAGRRVVNLTLVRNGQTLTKQVYPELAGPERLRSIGISPRSDLIVDKVSADSAAAVAALQPGDRIMAVDGKLLTRREELREYFQKKGTQPSTLTINRDGKTLTTSLQPRFETIEGQTAYLIGVTWRIESVTVHKTPLEQMGSALQQIYQTFSSLLNRHSDIGVRHMSSIVGIVDNLQQAASAGLIPTFAFLILINISLAIFNLFPIPVLDGGHIAIATLTKIRGRELNPAWMQNAIAACFIMLIGLIVYVSYYDIRRVIQNHSDPTPPPAAVKPIETPTTPAKPAKP